MLKPGGSCSENQVRVLLPACFSYENFMVWLCLLEFLCPSVIRMNSVSSACIISLCLLIYFHKNCDQHWWITALCINTYPVINCKSCTRCKLNKLIIGEVWIFFYIWNHSKCNTELKWLSGIYFIRFFPIFNSLMVVKPWFCRIIFSEINSLYSFAC